MIESLPNNTLIKKVLSSMERENAYQYDAKADRFRLRRMSFTNNYIILGKLTPKNRFKLKSTFKYPWIHWMFFIVGFVFAIYALINGNWLTTAILFLFFLTLLIAHKIQAQKEMKIFFENFRFHQKIVQETDSEFTIL
ncbi:MAG: hypothetical protein CL868_05145 [Cytophagaceae bacterium]|nr:hypothetical protein [Cytophagaceae bacterium]|tara:strand:+ start:4015 stop:4428 length:414 start_codon:yes stop_codon:yes gene_type:complete